MQDPAEGLRPEALARFWSWWSTVKDQVAAAIADQSLGRSPLVDEISANVHALHPDLAWELGPGRTSRHNLTVTAEGNLVLRRLTEQWLRAAPAPDHTWEYYASRQASAPMGLEIGGKRFAPEEFRITYAFDESRERFDVVLFHTQFKKSDDNLVRQVLFLTLDECLGEDDVERWVGSLDATKSAPANAVSLAEFVSVVGGARSNVTGERFTIGQAHVTGARSLSPSTPRSSRSTTWITCSTPTPSSRSANPMATPICGRGTTPRPGRRSPAFHARRQRDPDRSCHVVRAARDPPLCEGSERGCRIPCLVVSRDRTVQRHAQRRLRPRMEFRQDGDLRRTRAAQVESKSTRR